MSKIRRLERILEKEIGVPRKKTAVQKELAEVTGWHTAARLPGETDEDYRKRRSIEKQIRRLRRKS